MRRPSDVFTTMSTRCLFLMDPLILCCFSAFLTEPDKNTRAMILGTAKRSWSSIFPATMSPMMASSAMSAMRVIPSWFVIITRVIAYTMYSAMRDKIMPTLTRMSWSSAASCNIRAVIFRTTRPVMSPMNNMVIRKVIWTKVSWITLARLMD